MFEQQDQDRDKDRLRHHAIPPSPARPDLALGGSDSAHSSSPPRRPSRNRANSASNSSHATTMPQYTSRDVGDPTQIKKNKQSMADLKLRRLTELNNRLREDLERERIPVSQASKSIIAYCNSTRDYMVVTVWGVVPKGEDPYAPQQSGGCCLVM
ncbi:guanine nucleotide-binding protein subunit gamma [Diaporthe eres]|nr:guanine nucleotide-binding protein subunit gamma [Diaporthe eres]